MDKRFICVIPCYTKPIVGDPELEPLMPVALWKCEENVCEGKQPGSRCDDGEDLYYTVAGDEATYWCPRCWYEMHRGPGRGQRLIDMTLGQHAAECRAHKDRLLKDWAVVADRLETSARILAHAGLQDEAGKLWEAYGYVRSSIERL